MKINFDRKGRTPGLTLKKRPMVIRKWPIQTNEVIEPKNAQMARTSSGFNISSLPGRGDLLQTIYLAA